MTTINNSLKILAQISTQNYAVLSSFLSSVAYVND